MPTNETNERTKRTNERTNEQTNERTNERCEVGSVKFITDRSVIRHHHHYSFTASQLSPSHKRGQSPVLFDVVYVHHTTTSNRQETHSSSAEALGVLVTPLATTTKNNDDEDDDNDDDDSDGDGGMNSPNVWWKNPGELGGTNESIGPGTNESIGPDRPVLLLTHLKSKSKPRAATAMGRCATNTNVCIA